MKEYGAWMQLSVFQCRLTDMKRAELMTKVSDIINNREDSLMVLDLGPSDQVEIKVKAIGKLTFEPIEPKTRIF